MSLSSNPVGEFESFIQHAHTHPSAEFLVGCRDFTTNGYVAESHIIRNLPNGGYASTAECSTRACSPDNPLHESFKTKWELEWRLVPRPLNTLI